MCVTPTVFLVIISDLLKAWVKPDVAPFYLSPFSRKSLWPRDDIAAKSSGNAASTGMTATEISKTPEFILFLIWVIVGNLDCIFTIFTFSQFSQYVQGENYKGESLLTELTLN